MPGEGVKASLGLEEFPEPLGIATAPERGFAVRPGCLGWLPCCGCFGFQGLC